MPLSGSRNRAAMEGGSKVITLLADCKILPPNDGLWEWGCLGNKWSKWVGALEKTNSVGGNTSL